MNTWQLVIPYIGPKDNLASCIESMGEIVIPVLIVDNSKNSDTVDRKSVV